MVSGLPSCSFGAELHPGSASPLFSQGTGRWEGVGGGGEGVGGAGVEGKGVKKGKEKEKRGAWEGVFSRQVPPILFASGFPSVLPSCWGWGNTSIQPAYQKRCSKRGGQTVTCCPWTLVKVGCQGWPLLKPAIVPLPAPNGTS